VGGGPAGSSAAALLAQEGLHTVLLERASCPRNVVGESLIPHFWKFADRTGVAPKIEQEGFLAKAGGITVWRGRIHQFSFGSFGYARPAMHVERDRFDFLLLQHAVSCGTEAFDEVTATRVDLAEEDAPVVHFNDRRGGASQGGSIRCRYVVDASGHNVLLARQLGTRQLLMSESTKFMALWGYFDNARYVAADGRSYTAEHLRQTRPVTFVLSYEDGWVWHIPLRRNTSVGLVINTDRIRGLDREQQEQYFLATCARVPYLAPLLEPATYVPGSLSFMHDYSYYSTTVAGPGFFCIGDAAGFVDPIFSHGVQAAFYNASVCALAIQESLRHPRRTEAFRKLFETRVRQYYGFSRSLALGHLDSAGIDSDLVKSLMRSMSPTELEMMLVASSISDRSENFRRMAREAGVLGEFGEGFVSDRHQFLDELYV
jgi:flavin-dependent dehydrogenase